MDHGRNMLEKRVPVRISKHGLAQLIPETLENDYTDSYVHRGHITLKKSKDFYDPLDLSAEFERTYDIISFESG